jgi:hypothetical protein
MADQLGRSALFYANRPPERIPELKFWPLRRGENLIYGSLISSSVLIFGQAGVRAFSYFLRSSWSLDFAQLAPTRAPGYVSRSCR